MRSGVDHLRDTLPKDIPASEPEGVRAQAKTNIEVAAKNLDTVREVLDEMKPAYSAPRPSRPPDLREIPLWGVDLNYSPTEKTVLAERIPELMMEGGRRPSPRAVRLFLYKYQLCRTLLRLSQGAGLASEALPTDRALVDALGAACFNPAWRPAGKVNRATLDWSCNKSLERHTRIDPLTLCRRRAISRLMGRG